MEVWDFTPPGDEIENEAVSGREGSDAEMADMMETDDSSTLTAEDEEDYPLERTESAFRYRNGKKNIIP